MDGGLIILTFVHVWTVTLRNITAKLLIIKWKWSVWIELVLFLIVLDSVCSETFVPLVKSCSCCLYCCMVAWILYSGPSLRQPLCGIVSTNIVLWRLMSLKITPRERERACSRLRLMLILNCVNLPESASAPWLQPCMLVIALWPAVIVFYWLIL